MESNTVKVIYLLVTAIGCSAVYSLAGTIEAYLFHYKVNSKYLKSEPPLHKMFTVQRVIVALMASLSVFTVCGLESALLQLLTIGIQLPYIHDGDYYYVRNSLDPTMYKLRFRDQSTTSTAKINFNYVARLSLYLIGLAVLMLNIWMVCVS